jgi:PAS domain-containing protein
MADGHGDKFGGHSHHGNDGDGDGEGELQLSSLFPQHINLLSYKTGTPHASGDVYVANFLGKASTGTARSTEDDNDSMSDIYTERSDYDSDEGIGGKRKKLKSEGGFGEEGWDATKLKNREHSKNTRQRKKNYIEALKSTVKLFAEERENLDTERRIQLSKLAEQNRIRKRVLETLFLYRSNCETDPECWEALLEDNFVMSMPITPYRSFSPYQVSNGQRHVEGVQEMIIDTLSLDLLMQSLALSRTTTEQRIKYEFLCEHAQGIMASDHFMCKWFMRTQNATDLGARLEVHKSGMIEATYSQRNKLVALDITFDVMGFMQQLRRATNRSDFQVIPNTVSTATEDITEPRMIVEAQGPHQITFVNVAICNMFQYPLESFIGHQLGMLNGPDTRQASWEELLRIIQSGQPGSVLLTQYAGLSREPLNVSYDLYPLYSNGSATHYVLVAAVSNTRQGNGATPSTYSQYQEQVSDTHVLTGYY